MKAKIINDIGFEERVREIILLRIRPYLLKHGGDLSVNEIRGRDVGVVFGELAEVVRRPRQLLSWSWRKNCVLS